MQSCTDYSQQGAPIRVAIYDDRLEIDSPGVLLSGLTVPDMKQGNYLVNAFPSPERERADSLDQHAREMSPYAHLVRVFCPGVTALPNVAESAGRTDCTASSLVQAMRMCSASPRPLVAHPRTAVPA
jgi:hypothetical protein